MSILPNIADHQEYAAELAGKYPGALAWIKNRQAIRTRYMDAMGAIGRIERLETDAAKLASLRNERRKWAARLQSWMEADGYLRAAANWLRSKGLLTDEIREDYGLGVGPLVLAGLILVALAIVAGLTWPVILDNYWRNESAEKVELKQLEAIEAQYAADAEMRRKVYEADAEQRRQIANARGVPVEPMAPLPPAPNLPVVQGTSRAQEEAEKPGGVSEAIKGIGQVAVIGAVALGALWVFARGR